jgi:hypothetical protein
MSSQKHILLLGAGELGTAFLSALSSLPRSFTLTLAIRSPTKYTHLQTTYPSLILIPLDLSSPSHVLAETFSHYDVILSATGFEQTPDTLLKLAREAIDAGRLKSEREGAEEGKIWFFPWQWGVDYDITGDGEGLMPLFGAQKQVRDILRAQSMIDWTVVSTGIFMSFLFEQFWGVVDWSDQEGDEKVTVTALRNWEHGITVTDVKDIGKVLRRILEGDVEARNQVVYVAGETVTYGELANVVEKVTGTEVKREVWGIDYLEEEVKKDPEDGIKKYRLVFARDGVYWEKTGTVNSQLGMEMMSVEEYARKAFSR